MIFKKKNKKKSSRSSVKNKKQTTAATGSHAQRRKKTKQRRQPDNKKQPVLFKLLTLSLYFGLGLFLIGIFSLWLYGTELSRQYKLSDRALEGVLWELPSRVYARPLELFIDKPLVTNDLITELNYLDYRQEAKLNEPGTYYVDGNQVLIYKKSFGFWDGQSPEMLLRVTLSHGKVTGLLDMTSLKDVPVIRLEPLLIGSIYPKHGQDRVLIDLENTPSILVDTILAAEDRRFYQHPGVDPKGFIRAAYLALKNQRVSQGASTITQQFVKNHYLTRERSISRKVKEAIMAVIIESKHTKAQILEGYLNEIFLGQDGDRAIHGFGLASAFYFGKPLADLGVHQIASLVALVREPSRANPYQHPDFAKRRRALMLDVMVDQGLISTQDATLAKSLPLDLLPVAERGKKERYHSFLQTVYKQLDEDYDRESLSSGLNIFTTLDPIIQDEAERSIAAALPVLEKRHRLKNNFLQAASVIVNSATAEVVAIVGDRDATRKGYNRAIQARRQPGSLLKPVVYLAALEYPQKYTLATLLDDSPLVYKTRGETWTPKNYAKTNKGSVMLIDALVHSYNIPTARIGLDIGIHDVVGRLQDLGARGGLPEFPSIVLGSVGMSPYEVAQIYEALANGGYRMPLRVINSVTDAHDHPVNRYPMESIKVISDGPHYLIVKAMQAVVKRGTARRLAEKIPATLQVAGKTGTTDDYRDSWFAGFSGNYLNVVWIGNDDNQRTGLSGSNGAMRVWMDIMKDLPLAPLRIRQPNSVFEFPIDQETGLLMGNSCQEIHQTINLPFLGGSEPASYSECVSQSFDTFGAPDVDWGGDDGHRIDLNTFDNIGGPEPQGDDLRSNDLNLWYNQ